MNIKSIPALLGYLTHDLNVPAPTGPLFGLKTLLFGTSQHAYTQAIDHAGNLRGFLPMTHLTPQDYVPITAPYVPQLGDPHLRGFVTDPTQSNSILVMSWDAMAGQVLNSYPNLRAEFLRNPTAGRCLADFILKDVPRYQTSDRNESRLFEAFQFEIDRLRMDDDCLFGSSRLASSPSGVKDNWPNVDSDDFPQV